MSQVKQKDNLSASHDSLRLGSKEFKHIFGTTNVPNLLIDHQAELGLDIVELGILLHLLRYDYHDEFVAWPGIRTLRRKTGMGKNRIKEVFKRLENKKYLKITPQYNEVTKTWATNLYDFSPLFEKLQQLAQELIKFSNIMKSSKVESRNDLNDFKDESTSPPGSKIDPPPGSKIDPPLGLFQTHPGSISDPKENEKKENEFEEDELQEQARSRSFVSSSSSSSAKKTTTNLTTTQVTPLTDPTNLPLPMQYEVLAKEIAFNLNCEKQIKSIIGFISKYDLEMVETAWNEAYPKILEKEGQIRNPIAYLYGVIKNFSSSSSEMFDDISCNNELSADSSSSKESVYYEILHTKFDEEKIEEYKKTLSPERIKEITKEARERVRKSFVSQNIYEMAKGTHWVKDAESFLVKKILTEEIETKVKQNENK